MQLREVMRQVLCQLVFLVLLGAGSAGGWAASPFGVSPTLTRDRDGQVLQVTFTVATNTFLYADQLVFEVAGEPSPARFALPEPETIQDRFSGESKRVFTRSFDARYRLASTILSRVSLRVRWQGCDDANCYFPEEKEFVIQGDGTVKPTEAAAADVGGAAPAAWTAVAAGFTVRARGSGYLSEQGFLTLLDQTERGEGGAGAPSARHGGWGLFATLCLIVLGGVGLNLTPCVLPMIPINLAIIGAGAQAGSKGRGFALGGAYASGMAAAYGTLGVVVVLTGSKFGTLNSSPWFNLGIALVFGVLALGMFDVFAIDLSRFQGRRGRGARPARGSLWVAGSMGIVAALLAGACVAPVVISVLVQATALYNRGMVAGLFLPFVLGIGMGLPWPFAGAGLSWLPKPGVWMTRVKYGFGLLILLSGGYYGLLSLHLFRTAPAPIRASATGGLADDADAASHAELVRVLEQARRERKSVFIDFWASWCKNCSAMEHTTFKAAGVQRRLTAYLSVRFQAERPNQRGTKEVLDYFGVFGLPTYVFLAPKEGAVPSAGPATAAGTAPNDDPRKPGEKP
jgi:thioredoxin:protein disulfide reductase